MKTSDLIYDFPKNLIATKPQRPSRVLFNQAGNTPKEIPFAHICDIFKPNDVLVLNETKVIPSRVRDENGVDFLFVRPTNEMEWEVLFPAKAFKVGQSFSLPGDLKVTLIEKALPQKVRLSYAIDFNYFEQYGEVNLPPYILEQRSQQSTVQEDRAWYQTAWAKHIGSVAAPTASLHFSDSDLDQILKRGVKIQKLTLHVGLGTFLPIRAKDLSEHKMHFEWVSIPSPTLQALETAKAEGYKVWAMGTTVARSLESISTGHLQKNRDGDLEGQTDIFIYPPYEFKVVDGLLTNFHQPESTLLAMVCAFYGRKQVMEAYQYAIQNHFRLFSYGDLSVWTK